MIYMKGRGAWWPLHLIPGPQYISLWSKIFVLYIIICLYIYKSEIKSPESWGRHSGKEKWGKWGRGGREKDYMVISTIISTR
jgi:hypothetical protein